MLENNVHCHWLLWWHRALQHLAFLCVCKQSFWWSSVSLIRQILIHPFYHRFMVHQNQYICNIFCNIPPDTKSWVMASSLPICTDYLSEKAHTKTSNTKSDFFHNSILSKQKFVRIWLYMSVTLPPVLWVMINYKVLQSCKHNERYALQHFWFSQPSNSNFFQGEYGLNLLALYYAFLCIVMYLLTAKLPLKVSNFFHFKVFHDFTLVKEKFKRATHLVARLYIKVNWKRWPLSLLEMFRV